MALTKQTEVVAIHQLQDNEPNDVGGLTAAQFKAICDQAAVILNDYNNEVLTEELDAKFASIEGVGRTTENLAEAYTNLETHKDSADHDERYYTETEADAQFATKAEVQGVVLGQIPDDSLTAAKMDAGVKASLGKADSAYQKPESGIPLSDMATASKLPANLAVNVGTVAHGEAIPQTAGYTNYKYFVSINTLSGSTGASNTDLHAVDDTVSVNQTTREVTCQRTATLTNGISETKNGTANYMEIAWK